MPKRRPKSRPAPVAHPPASAGTVTAGPATAPATAGSRPIVTDQSNSLATPLPGDDDSPVNDLARRIEPYTKPIAAAVAVLAIAVVALTLYRSRQTENRSDATLQLARASATSNTDDLTSIAATYPGTPAAAWAKLYEGSIKMAAGMTALFESRDEAEELLGDAESAYRTALQSSRDRILRSRAHYGLAQIAEARGEIDEAKVQYQEAMSAGESDAMVEVAKERIAVLERPQSQEFLTWFSAQDFSPAEPSLPPALPELGDLPDEPDFGPLDLEMPTDNPADQPTDQSTDQPQGVSPRGAPEPADQPTVQPQGVSPRGAPEPADQPPPTNPPSSRRA